MKPRKKLVICLAFLAVSSWILSADDRLKTIDDEVTLQFSMLESAVQEGAYITGNLEQLGFKKYDGMKLPREKDLKQRMYTFRAVFFLDTAVKGHDLSVHLGPADYPLHLYLNGTKIYVWGRYGKHYNSTAYNSPNIYLPAKLLHYGAEKNEIAIQIFPRYEVRPLGTVTILAFTKGAAQAFFRDLLNIHLIQGACLIAFILFLYFLFLFISHGSRDLRYLFFSLTCLFFLISYFNISYSNDMVNEVLNEKISRIGFPLTTVFLSLFIIEYTGFLKKRKFFNRLIKVIIAIPAVISTFLFLFKDSKQAVHKQFDSVMMYFLLPLLVFTFSVITWYVVVSIKSRRGFSPLVVWFGFIAIIITSITDIIYVMALVAPYAWVIPYGYVFMVLCIFFTLSIEQSLVHKKSEDTLIELEKKNSSLKKVMDNISYVAGNLVESSTRLESNIGKSVEVIEKNRETNKQMLESIISQFDSIEAMLLQVANRITTSSERIPQAITRQTSAVGDVNNIMSKMKSDIESTSVSSIESSETANKLANIADESSKIVTESKRTISKISEYSDFINQVMSAIEDITEKTSLLSINASIEAANSGIVGKGFSVIASEIRNLAAKSKKNLESSFENLNNMKAIIEKSNMMADEVYTRLFNIIDESKRSAVKINDITAMIEEQKTQSATILQAVERLLNDTTQINMLCEQEQQDDEKIKTTLLDFKNSFEGITGLLREQEQKEIELHTSINSIREVMSENLKNVDILNSSLQT
ncbi:MAG: methyl-accepting chemotaxis protein [Spirochaetia bacterium]